MSKMQKKIRVLNAFIHLTNNALRNGGRHLMFTNGRSIRVKRALLTITMTDTHVRKGLTIKLLHTQTTTLKTYMRAIYRVLSIIFELPYFIEKIKTKVC